MPKMYLLVLTFGSPEAPLNSSYMLMLRSVPNPGGKAYQKPFCFFQRLFLQPSSLFLIEAEPR